VRERKIITIINQADADDQAEVVISNIYEKKEINYELIMKIYNQNYKKKHKVLNNRICRMNMMIHLPDYI